MKSLDGLKIIFALLLIGNLIAIFSLVTGTATWMDNLRLIWVSIFDFAFALILLRYEILPATPVGTKSLLVGAHQFLWHPLTVLLAWIELRGLPNWKTVVCIFIHDWGYWGKPNMDGPEGEKHPEWAGLFADKYLDNYSSPHYYRELCLCHSRYFAKLIGEDPSPLCWADKLAVKYDPWFIYLPRVWLSGEIKEYRERAHAFGEVKPEMSDIEWYRWAQERMIRKAYGQDARPAYEAH